MVISFLPRNARWFHCVITCLNIGNSTLCHTNYLCFLWFVEQTAIISVCRIDWLGSPCYGSGGLSPRYSGFNLRPFHVRFCRSQSNTVAGCCPSTLLFCSITRTLLHIHSIVYLSPKLCNLINRQRSWIIKSSGSLPFDKYIATSKASSPQSAI
jgi:hypothetical protein